MKENILSWAKQIDWILQHAPELKSETRQNLAKMKTEMARVSRELTLLDWRLNYANRNKSR